jgi:hypothetical protein
MTEPTKPGISSAPINAGVATHRAVVVDGKCVSSRREQPPEHQHAQANPPTFTVRALQSAATLAAVSPTSKQHGDMNHDDETPTKNG